MSGIYQILNTAKEGLLASQISLGVTGANVTNASTPGYVRQRAVLAAKSPGEVAGNAVQTGVEVTTIERLYSRFIEFQLVEQSSQVGEAGIRKETLERVETIFNETEGGGLNELMNRFWQAWEDLSANPAGQVERTALANAADFRSIWTDEPYRQFRTTALTTSKRDPFFAPIACLVACDNLGQNIATQQRLAQLTLEQQEALKKSKLPEI